MVKFVSNLPDSEHSQFPVIDPEPNPFTIAKFFRGSDYALMMGTTFGMPGALYLWERRSPSIHPRLIPKVMAYTLPFSLCVGYILAFERTLFRFWGKSENTREQRLYAEHTEKLGPQKPKGWEDS